MCLLRHFRTISNLSPAGSFRIFDDIAICLYFFLENTRQCFTHCCCERHSFGSISEGWGGRGETRRSGSLRMRNGTWNEDGGNTVEGKWGRCTCWGEDFVSSVLKWWKKEMEMVVLEREWRMPENGNECCVSLKDEIRSLLLFTMIRTSFKWNMHIISFKTSIRSISYS